MSPVQAMERSYAALKQLLREGGFAPGARLEANRLADQLGVSMTPVRDVLHRLAGEGLVTASAGEGFHVPVLTEAELRDLYEWHSALAVMAVRTARSGNATVELLDAALHPADATALVFDRVAAHAPNHALRAEMARIGDRLHPFRRVEDMVLEPIIGEIDALLLTDGHQAQAIRRYHLRRMRAAPALLLRLRHPAKPL